MYFVYIIYSESFDVFYKGFTQNLEKRFFEHNNDFSRYTSKRGPWELVYSKSFENKSEALKEEKRIKKLDRQSLLALKR